MKQLMKKAAAGILTAAIVSSLGAASAFAAGHGCGRNFVDADGNGVCDYAGISCRCIDSDQDGLCDNCGQGRFSQNVDRPNYVDSDGDGVCDHYAQGHRRGLGCKRNE